MSARDDQLRLLEAMLFAAAAPLGPRELARQLPEGADLDGLVGELTRLYADRGVNLVRVGQRWAFRTAPDLARRLLVEQDVRRKLSRAAVETLAVIAYHQPVTRGEIEEIRGVSLSKGTLDTLLECGWIKPKGRRRTPGRPATWGTTEAFLDHFGLEDLDALPGVADLKAAGLLDTRPAISVAEARGLVPKDQDGRPESDADEAAETDPWTRLSSEFGEELGPGRAGPASGAEEAAAAPPADESTPAGEDGQAPPPVETDIHSQ